eukprot:TRINITY_DN17772_c0_g1_i4.p1 TRINITY_DN17772_c0_g1~~TRINITY_DN17772_c0_g1_i4.p1  ORF type:complete len:127 (+),score=26.36 TRINITY_DN17772_c0_g1_i4:276-656(+)
MSAVFFSRSTQTTHASESSTSSGGALACKTTDGGIDCRCGGDILIGEGTGNEAREEEDDGVDVYVDDDDGDVGVDIDVDVDDVDVDGDDDNDGEGEAHTREFSQDRAAETLSETEVKICFCTVVGG